MGCGCNKGGRDKKIRVQLSKDTKSRVKDFSNSKVKNSRNKSKVASSHICPKCSSKMSLFQQYSAQLKQYTKIWKCVKCKHKISK
jgi:DNA-directed RNA polymerase subunit M/transcription elongation factor TFIIS